MRKQWDLIEHSKNIPAIFTVEVSTVAKRDLTFCLEDAKQLNLLCHQLLRSYLIGTPLATGFWGTALIVYHPTRGVQLFQQCVRPIDWKWGIFHWSIAALWERGDKKKWSSTKYIKSQLVNWRLNFEKRIFSLLQWQCGCWMLAPKTLPISYLSCFFCHPPLMIHPGDLLIRLFEVNKSDHFCNQVVCCFSCS